MCWCCGFDPYGRRLLSLHDDGPPDPLDVKNDLLVAASPPETEPGLDRRTLPPIRPQAMPESSSASRCETSDAGHLHEAPPRNRGTIGGEDGIQRIQ